MKDKIKTIEEIEKIAAELRSQGKKIVTTSGSFDILHSGHTEFLQKAKGEGDCLIVLLNTDESIKQNKGDNRPIIPQKERAVMLASLQSVDYVVLFSDRRPFNVVEKIKSHTHTKGGANNPENLRKEVERMKQLGCDHKVFELKEGYSTTNLINTIIEKYKLKKQDQ